MNPFSPMLCEKELAKFSRSLSVLLAARWPAARIFETLQKQTTNKRLSAALSSMTPLVKAGKTISESILTHEKLFGPVFCRAVAGCETTAALSAGVQKLAEYYERNEAFSTHLRRTVRPPAIVVFAAAGIVISLLLSFSAGPLRQPVLPHAGNPPAAGLPAAVHASVRLLLITAAGVAGLVLLTLPVAPVFLTGFRKVLRAIPFFGDFLRKLSLRRFCLSLSTMLAAGIPPFRSLHGALAAQKHSVWTAIAPHKSAELMKAEGTTASMIRFLRDTDILPFIIIGALPDTASNAAVAEHLNKAAGFYEEEINAAVNAMVILAGPVATALLGLAGVSALLMFVYPL